MLKARVNSVLIFEVKMIGYWKALPSQNLPGLDYINEIVGEMRNWVNFQ